MKKAKAARLTKSSEFEIPLSNIEDRLVQDLEAKLSREGSDKTETLIDFMETVFRNVKSKDEDSIHRLRRKIMQELPSLTFTEDQALKFFCNVSEWGPLPEIDSFFRAHLTHRFALPLSEERTQELSDVLSKNRIFSERLQFELVNIRMEQEIHALEAKSEVSDLSLIHI